MRQVIPSGPVLQQYDEFAAGIRFCRHSSSACCYHPRPRRAGTHPGAATSVRGWRTALASPMRRSTPSRYRSFNRLPKHPGDRSIILPGDVSDALKRSGLPMFESPPGLCLPRLTLPPTNSNMRQVIPSGPVLQQYDEFAAGIRFCRHSSSACCYHPRPRRAGTHPGAATSVRGWRTALASPMRRSTPSRYRSIACRSTQAIEASFSPAMSRMR